MRDAEVGEGRREDARVLQPSCDALDSSDILPLSPLCLLSSPSPGSLNGAREVRKPWAARRSSEAAPGCSAPPREILLAPRWVFGKWLGAPLGNTKKLKEKPEGDRREFWHSSKAQNRCFCLLSGIFHYNLLCRLSAVEQLGLLSSLPAS